MTDVESQHLLALAVAEAQSLLNSWSREGLMPIGAPLICTVRIPQAYPDEHYMLVSRDTGPQKKIDHVHGLSVTAGARLTVEGGLMAFARWQALQTWSEPWVFAVNTNIVPIKKGSTSGIVLPH